jgi:putative sterol carrier protein
VTYRLQYQVKGGPAFSTVVDDDRLLEAVPGDEEEGADLVLQLSKADASALGTGELLLDEGFMQGRVKVVGPIGVFMALVPLLRRADYGAAVAAIAAG